jgi:hypothetical protein
MTIMNRKHKNNINTDFNIFPLEIYGNIFSHLNIYDIINFMTTNKNNYNNIINILKTPHHFNLNKYNKYITININIIHKYNLLSNNLIKLLLPYLYFKIKQNKNIILLEKYFKDIKYKKNVLSLCLSVKLINNNTTLFNNINNLQLQNIMFNTNIFNYNNCNINNLSFNNCNITNDMIKNINSINILTINNCVLFKEYNNNIKTNTIIISNCSNFKSFGNINNNNNIKITNCNNIIDYTTLNNKNINILHITQCNIKTLKNLSVNNITINTSIIENIYNIHNIKNIKLLNSKIANISNISNINTLYINNCKCIDLNLLNRINYINLNNIKQINNLNIKYKSKYKIINNQINNQIHNIPIIKLNYICNINKCKLININLDSININNCNELIIKTHTNINENNNHFIFNNIIKQKIFCIY